MLNSISGRQIKAARALLGWTRKDLAGHVGVTAETVQIVESDETIMPALAGTRERMRRVLEAAGIAFTNGGSPGVRVMPADHAVAVGDLNASNDD
ncbi:helix-turn-helix domain-containing protein [Xanthobacter sp. ZOL 2024]